MPSSDALPALKELDTCSVANAIETFDKRLRNEGFGDGSLRCLFPEFPPMVGYAATLTIRGSNPPMSGGHYSDRTDYWEYIQSLPSPRVLVIRDMTSRIGLGSFLDRIQMNILKSLNCVGAMTNGSVRDLPYAQELGFQLFSETIAISHAYIHIVEFGTPVDIAGLKINSGDLIHGDQHGFQTIPLDLAEEIPSVAQRLKKEEEAIIALCRHSPLPLEQLRAAVAPRLQ